MQELIGNENNYYLIRRDENLKKNAGPESFTGSGGQIHGEARRPKILKLVVYECVYVRSADERWMIWESVGVGL